MPSAVRPVSYAQCRTLIGVRPTRTPRQQQPDQPELGPKSNRRPNRRPIGQILRWPVVLVTIALLAVIAISRWDTLSDTQLQISIQWLVPASLAALLASFLLPVGWRELLAAYRNSLKLNRAVRIWSLSQTTRYLPSGLVPVAARASLAAQAGVKRVVTGVSVIVEIAILLGWTALAGAIWAPGDWIQPAFRWALGLAALTGLLTLPFTLAGVRLDGKGRLASWLSDRAVTVLRWLGVKEELRDSLKEGLLQANRYGIWRAAAMYGAAVATRLVAFVLLAAAVLPLNETASDVWLIIGASAASLLVGMVGITPAGLGVRETLLTTLLTARFGLGDALAYSVLLRAWEFALELLFLGAAIYIGRHRA